MLAEFRSMVSFQNRGETALMRKICHRIFICVVLTIMSLSAKAEDGCTTTAGTTKRWHSSYEHIDGEMFEEIIGQEGILTLHAAKRSLGNSAPELSLDILFGGIYVGDLGDLFDVPFTTITARGFARIIEENPTFFKDLLTALRASRPKQMDAIANVYENFRPGSEINYRFNSSLSRTIRVLEPEKINLAFAGDKEVLAARLEIEQHYLNGESTTARYWFTPETRSLVRYWTDHGKTLDETLVECSQR